MQIDKNLSFLNSYVQQALEIGAQPYIPESERSGMLSISNFRSQDQHEASMHGLRFEAYELPKPSVPSRPPVSLVSATELVPVPEPSYPRVTQNVASVPSVSSTDPSELRLRLDGVQKKWGRPTYSSSETSTSTSTSEKTVNGVTKVDPARDTLNSKVRDTSYDSRKSDTEIPPEKQKLAASLFGGSSKTEKRASTTGHRAGKASSHVIEKPQASKASDKTVAEKTIVQPPPDLLDLGEPAVLSSSPSIDPFKQLEGLLDSSQVPSDTNDGAAGANKDPDIMGLYADTAGSGQSTCVANPVPTNKDDLNLLSGLSNSTTKRALGGTPTAHSTQVGKGPNTKDSLEKDALVRQMGVTPTSQNPNLFKDLLG